MKAWILVSMPFVIVMLGCSHKVPLRIVQSGNRVTIDVQTLGEYQTTVRRIRLLNKQSHEVVWELAAQTGTPQINVIDLQVGENPAVLTGVASGTYAVVSPAGATTFGLAPGVEYEIEVWGDRKKATGTFRLVSRPSV
jgi:hypothetical protein